MGPQPHTHTPKRNGGRGLYLALQLGREGELRARVCTSTCPPRAVWSSLSGGGTRTHRLNAAPSTRDEGQNDGRQSARRWTRWETTSRQALKAGKTSTDPTTPGEADPDSQTERPDHYSSPEVGGISSLATRLLIGRLRRAIRWPSLMGQAHGRRGNSHLSGAESELRRL